ncbi:hypothetical protein D3C78_1935130 [compost metagenome]
MNRRNSVLPPMSAKDNVMTRSFPSLPLNFTENGAKRPMHIIGIETRKLEIALLNPRSC